MKILLINPNLQIAEIGHYSKFIEKLRGVYPPIGLGYVASSLEKNGHDVKIIDCGADIKLLENIENEVKKFDPEVVGIYVMTWTFRQANEIAKKIKKINPNVKIVIGGPNVSSFPNLSLKISEFDYAILGEGEITINKLIKEIEMGEGKGKLKKIKGLIFKNNGKVTLNKSRPIISNLDGIPFPAWHLLPIKKYYDVFTREKKFITMITSRGCPYNCTFCDRKNRLGNVFRMRSPENILAEIELLNSEYGIKEFMFFDDNFTVNKKRVIELCKLIRKNKLDIIWECRTRADLVDKELLGEMKLSGCYRIRYGMEAGDDRILKVLKKRITVSQILDCVKITKEVGIEIFAYFMMGSPYESIETLEKTLKLALKIDPDFVAFSKTTIIPGTEILEWAEKNNYIKKNYWKLYLLGEEKDGAPSLSTKILPGNLLDSFISFSNKKFYLRPKYVIKRVLNIKNFSQLQKQSLVGMRLLF